MPIYEYQCTNCGHEEESLEKMDAPRTKKCPACGSADTLQRLVSAPRFQLKGSGWYQTDFKDSGKTKPATEDSSKSTDKTKTGQDKAADKKDTTTETKPAAESNSTKKSDQKTGATPA